MSKERRYVVREGERLDVSAVLARLGEGRDAVAEGRVFVGRMRVRDAAQRVVAGDEVRVAAAAAATPAPPPVLYEDDDFVCVAKPAGLPTVPGPSGGAHSLVAVVARGLGVRVEALTPTSRLDRDVSGVVTFAKSGAAAARVAQARERGTHARRYVALAAKGPSVPDDRARGEWTWPIGRAKSPLLRAIGGPDAKEARSRFAVIARAHAGTTMLALAPETGRTHQLRVHASHAGAPLLGDRDYGGPMRVVLATGKVVSLARIALHCARVRVPVRAEVSVDVVAPVPIELATLWETLGGAPEAWNEASSCDL